MIQNVLPLAVALTYTVAPCINLNATCKDPITALKQNPSTIILAESHADEDPHGKDPHDEVHDNDLPANEHDTPANDKRHSYDATKKVYGRDVPNDHTPAENQ